MAKLHYWNIQSTLRFYFDVVFSSLVLTFTLGLWAIGIY